MFDWFYPNEVLVEWVVLVSIVSFALVLLAVPVILAVLPKDYFLQPESPPDIWPRSISLLQLLFLISRNLIGVVLVFIGILMLVLPGQGILTIVIGLVLTKFPGKYKVERWFISRPRVLAMVNWTRAKINKPAFEIDTDRKAEKPD